MIEVESLTKRYGRTTAVDGVSFRVERGEILGFLGPNGAGKTTTMRILTCYLPPTEGTARVAGYDVFSQPMEVKRRVGYLPETPPLYPDMSVREYLDFCSRIKGVPAKERKARVAAAIEKCRVGDVRDKLIAKLSKGYRQRVGLAQAILHNPDVLILDEPTAGLDPKQIIETRELIRSLAGRPHRHPLHPHPPRGLHDLRAGGDHQQGPGGRGGHPGQPDPPPEGRGHHPRGGDGARRRRSWRRSGPFPASSPRTRAGATTAP